VASTAEVSFLYLTEGLEMTTATTATTTPPRGERGAAVLWLALVSDFGAKSKRVDAVLIPRQIIIIFLFLFLFLNCVGWATW
jgi:hypothetical protein